MSIKVYVSGQITGLSQEEYHAEFDRAEKVLVANDFEVVNPLKVQACLDEKCSTSGIMKDDGSYLHAYSCYMKYDIIAMLGCRVIAMLPNWRNSSGAQFELKVASKCGLEVFYFDATTEGLVM